MLGKNYNTLKVFDYVNDEEFTIKDYISLDKDNIVFYVKPESESQTPVLFATTRGYLAEKMAIYDIAANKKYLSMNLLGYPGIGVMSYDGVKRAVLRSNYQIFALRETGTTGKLTTHEIRYFGDNVIGGLHGQEGTQQSYYQIYIPYK